MLNIGEELWTGPVALAPKHIRHRFLAEGVRRFAFGEDAKISSSSGSGLLLQQQQTTLHENPVGLLAASWSEGIPGAVVQRNASDASASSTVPPNDADRDNGGRAGDNDGDDEDDDGKSDLVDADDMDDDEHILPVPTFCRSSLLQSQSPPTQSQHLSVEARHRASVLLEDLPFSVAAAGIKRATSNLLIALSAAKQAEIEEAPQSVSRGKELRRMWKGNEDLTAQIMMVDHCDRALQQKPEQQQQQQASTGGEGQTQWSQSAATTLHASPLCFSTAVDPLQSFLFLRLHNLPFQISNAAVRRRLLLDADRALFGKNAGSEFLLGPAAAAARDKARDLETLESNPTWLQGIAFIDSDEDDDDGNEMSPDVEDIFNSSFGVGSLEHAKRENSASSPNNDSLLAAAKTEAKKRRQSNASNSSHTGSGGGGGRRGGDGERIPQSLDAAWIKSQTRLMSSGLLFALDSVFGERKAGDKSYERSSRIRNLFMRNDSVNELIAWSCATCFGGIRALVSAEDLVLGLSGALSDWPQLMDENLSSASNRRRSTLIAADRSNSTVDAATAAAAATAHHHHHHHHHLGRAGRGSQERARSIKSNNSNDNYGDDGGSNANATAAVVNFGMTDAELRREAEHAAVVAAMEKRLGLGKFEANPVQAACDRAGLWFSMSQPRASTAPAHVSISDRMATYVAADQQRKGAVIGYDVPGEGDSGHGKRRACLLKLAASFAGSLRIFLERARNPTFFREASQALPQIVAIAACRIFDDLRTRAFKEHAKLKKREMLTQLTQGYAAAAAAASSMKGSSLLAEQDKNNGSSSSNNNSGATEAKYMSASELNRKLRDHWSASTQQVHTMLLQCRRELVFLLSGVDTFKPTFQPRAGEALIPPKQIVVATNPAVSSTESSAEQQQQQQHASPASTVAGGEGKPQLQTRRSIVPPWANRIGVVKRHPRLQWVLKLAETETEKKEERFKQATGNARKKDALPDSIDKDDEGASSPDKTTKTSAEAAVAASPDPKKLLLQPPSAISAATDSPSSSSTPNREEQQSPSLPQQQQERQQQQQHHSRLTAKFLKSHNIDGKVLHHGPPAGTAGSSGSSSNNNYKGAKSIVGASIHDDSKYRRDIQFVPDAPILTTGSHAGKIENMAGEKRLRTPLLSWQKMEDGSTHVMRADIHTFKKVVQQDMAQRKMGDGSGSGAGEDGEGGGGGGGGDRGLAHGGSDNSFGNFGQSGGIASFLQRRESLAGPSFRDRSGSVMSFHGGFDNSFTGAARSETSITCFLGSAGASGGRRRRSTLFGGSSSSAAKAANLGSALGMGGHAGSNNNNNNNNNNKNSHSHHNLNHHSHHQSIHRSSVVVGGGGVAGGGGGTDCGGGGAGGGNGRSDVMAAAAMSMISTNYNVIMVSPPRSILKPSSIVASSDYTIVDAQTGAKQEVELPLPPASAASPSPAPRDSRSVPLFALSEADNQKQRQVATPPASFAVSPNSGGGGGSPGSNLRLHNMRLLSNASSTAPAATGALAGLQRRARHVAWGALPTNPARQRKVLYGDNAELQPRALRYALREILHEVTTNTTELHATAAEAAQDSKAMQRQRSQVTQQTQQQAEEEEGEVTPSSQSPSPVKNVAAALLVPESEPVTAVADAISRQFQRCRQRVREEEAAKAIEQDRQHLRKQRWSARQLERQFNAEEGILGVDGGKFAIAVRADHQSATAASLDPLVASATTAGSISSSSSATMTRAQREQRQKLLAQQAQEEEEEDNDEHADLNPKKLSVWDEPEDVHPLLHVVIDYRRDATTGKIVAKVIPPDETAQREKEKELRSGRAQLQRLQNKEQQLMLQRLVPTTPILEGVVKSVPASRAALVHAYAQSRNDSYANRRVRNTAVSADADSVVVGLRSSVDARRVEHDIQLLAAQKAKEQEALVLRGQASGAAHVVVAEPQQQQQQQRANRMTPKPPASSQSARQQQSQRASGSTASSSSLTARAPPAATNTASSSSATASASSSSAAAAFRPSDVGPWYAQGQPKHRAPLIEQRENPYGKFHLAQGSPLLHLGMHSLSGGSGATSGFVGRRDVKWTLG